MRSARILLLSAVFFAGCGYQVAITYLKPRQPSTSQASIANVYLLVRRPPILDADTHSKFGFLSESDLPVDLDINRFAAQVALFLRDRGGRLAAYRVQKTQGDEVFSEGLKPSSILVVEFAKPELSEDHDTEEREEKDGDRTVKKVIDHWTVKASMGVSTALYRYPDNALLGSGQKNLDSSQTYDKPGESALRSRYVERVRLVTDEAADWAVKAAIPIDIVTRTRKLYAVSSDTTSATAAEAASAQHWNQAVPVWEARLEADAKDWRDAWNLGVWSEGQRDFSSAVRYYRTSQAAAMGDPDAPTPEVWSGMMQDCDQPLGMTDNAPDTSQSWFAQRVAVLPFTDVSTSIDGPLNVRRLTHEALAHSGYDTLPLEEVDRILKENGFTQGGQLTATTPQQLAQWLKADLLVYGHLEKFDEITLGLFGWKRVAGSYKIWSRAKNDYAWVSEKRVSRLSLTTAKNGSEAGWGFLQQLVSSWVQKAVHAPMAEESAYYVEQQLVEFPRRPV